MDVVTTPTCSSATDLLEIAVRASYCDIFVQICSRGAAAPFYLTEKALTMQSGWQRPFVFLAHSATGMIAFSLSSLVLFATGLILVSANETTLFAKHKRSLYVMLALAWAVGAVMVASFLITGTKAA